MADDQQVKQHKKTKKTKKAKKSKQAGDPTANLATATPTIKPKTLLVIGGSPKYNFYQLFGDTLLHGSIPIRVEMAHWHEINLVAYGDSSTAVLDLSPAAHPIPNTSMYSHRSGVIPDFLLVRSANRGLYGQDWRNILYGLMYCNIPSINTLESLYWCQEKPILYSKLKQVQKRLGKEQFPLIDQTYYASWKTMTFTTGFPLVAKIGTAHSGFGKMRITNESDFDDFRSVIALQDKYVTTEPFIDWDYDFRIQKIGDHYRAFRRYSANWKGKGMNQRDEDIEVTPRYRLWIDSAAEALGMDVCALDGVHSRTDDKEYILEMNDSAIGFNIRHEQEDLQHLKQLVIRKMEQAFKP